MNRLITLGAMLVLLALSSQNVRAQKETIASRELSAAATLKEAIDWTTQMIANHAAVGVYRRKDGKIVSGYAFVKGFQLDRADGCTLFLRNEKVDAASKTSRICEVTLPIQDLDPSTSIVYRSTSKKRDLDEMYGTWMLLISTMNGKTTARIYERTSPLGDFSGSVVEFSFEDKETAMVFQKGLKQANTMCRH